MINKILKVILDKNYRFVILANLGVFNSMNDEKFLKKMFQAKMGYKLNLNNPCTYNEKLQWLKLYDRKEEYTKLVDKFEVRDYVKNKVGEKYLIPLIGVWENVDEIDFDKLPKEFVLKCTHNSGYGMTICKDKDSLEIKKVKRELKKGLKENYYFSGREWPYKNVKPRIIAEELIGDKIKAPLDYKFFTFNGKIDSIMVCSERETGNTKFKFFDVKWNRLMYQYNEMSSIDEVEKPVNLDEMIQIVEELSKGYHQIRIDLYNIEGKIYFGEMTFYNQSGYDLDISKETDYKWGKKIYLPERSKNDIK
ncbi:ATP-grasp fold amidoligase family protein [Clostridium perfringens]|nr:ATP-grasp fold amidoligase family protein [Clostridium perfringens]